MSTEDAIKEALASKLPPAERPRIKGEPRLLTEWDLDVRSTNGYAIKGIVPKKGVGMIFGGWGTFKSFIALDMMAHMSNGLPWMGRRVKKTPCVYVPLEGQGGIDNRIRAWREAMSFRSWNMRIAFKDDPLSFPQLTLDQGQSYNSNILFYMDPINLRAQADRDKFVDMLLERELTSCCVNIDTLAQAAVGLEENGSDMGEMLGIAQELSERLEGVVEFTAHEGKTNGKGVRGWSGIEGALDFALQIKRPDPSRKEGVIHVYKFKDGEQGYDLTGFYMEPVPLGIDDDGDPVTSLVVMQQIGPPPAPPCPTVEDRASADADFVLSWVEDEWRREPEHLFDASYIVFQSAKWPNKMGKNRIYEAVARLVDNGLLKRNKNKELAPPPDENDSAGVPA